MASDFVGTPRAPPRRVVLDDAGRVVTEGGTPGSDAATFVNRDPTTSEADVLGGVDNGYVWGTTISLADGLNVFRDFLRNFTLKYRMYGDGMTDEEVQESPFSDTKIHWETLERMLMLGETRFYLDIRDMNLYPPTKKMWHQLQNYPHEIVPILDQALKDCLMEVAHAEDQRNRPSQSSAGQQASQQNTQSSEPVFPSSDRPEEPPTPRPRVSESLEDQVAAQLYFVRPYGLDKSTNLRDLNPSGKMIQPTQMLDEFCSCTNLSF